MNEKIKSFIIDATKARSMSDGTLIQRLWSGYGKILKIKLRGAERRSVIVKYVQLPHIANHPRGWHSDVGHRRKVKSYQVEASWYEHYSKESRARLPECIATKMFGDEYVLILEDLDDAGFPLRKGHVGWDDISSCLQWLAYFHASFINREPEGLWKIGTYWHLDTRPHELDVLADLSLKKAAAVIDARLNNCTYKTLVHGDAKLANFCFGTDGAVAAVDFQYVGGGCGMKDVAYFVGSCLSDNECDRLENEILDTYFGYLQNALPHKNPALETEWRSLYRVAWADFHRFLKGWSPGHWKINSYSERITSEVINALR